jgi:Fe2+ transport system protein FeoA
MRVVGNWGEGETLSMNVGHKIVTGGARTEESRCELCPLSRIRAGVAVRIKQLCASPEVQNRLREIGFGEEQVVRLITSQSNFICLVCNTRLAISEQLAQLILVEPVLATVRI